MEVKSEAAMTPAADFVIQNLLDQVRIRTALSTALWIPFDRLTRLSALLARDRLVLPTLPDQYLHDDFDDDEPVPDLVEGNPNSHLQVLSPPSDGSAAASLLASSCSEDSIANYSKPS